MNTNEIMSSLAEYMRLADETAAIIDGLKDQLKAAMQAAGTDTIIGTEHKASYKTVVSSRIDTAALKKRNRKRQHDTPKPRKQKDSLLHERRVKR